MTPELEQLLEAAYRQTLAGFRREVERGEREPAAELAMYRRRRRDYATCLRMERTPDEARELADRLLQTHGLEVDEIARREFDAKVTVLLVRLYDAFLAEGGNQGSR